MIAAFALNQAKPSPDQLAWQGMETNAFVHFGPNTFSGEEWGSGTERPELFDPKRLDCRQWVRTFKQAGFKGVIITAKHHDGFCLWPSRFSQHTVAQSAWRGGKGDVLRDLSDACRAEGLKFGVYLSPWDRNHPSYGTAAYNDVFVHMLHEVLTQYGPVFEVWFDGANGEGPNGKRQIYDWPRFVSAVRQDAPHAVIFSDAGPDVRWVGNESGFAGETNWNTIDRSRYVPGTPLYAELTEGTKGAPDWVPAECDVSIRPGWFWKQSEEPKSVAQLMEIYYGSVGRGANLLLNVPPTADGLIDERDAARLMEFRRARELDFQPIASDHQKRKGAVWTLRLRKPAQVSRVLLAEEIARGQSIEGFRVTALQDGAWVEVSRGTTIGHQRMLRFPAIAAQELRVEIFPASAAGKLTRFVAATSTS